MAKAENNLETKAEVNNRSKIVQSENNDLKNQLERLALVKKNMDNERQQLIGKVKSLENSLGEERKKSGGKQLDMTKEIKVWQNKEHQFVNELRKKELQLQSIQDRMRYVTDKDSIHN